MTLPDQNRMPSNFMFGCALVSHCDDLWACLKSHVLNLKYELLPSGRRYRVPVDTWTDINSSFIPQSVTLLKYGVSVLYCNAMHTMYDCHCQLEFRAITYCNLTGLGLQLWISNLTFSGSRVRVWLGVRCKHEQNMTFLLIIMVLQ